jgi:sulfopyruvate decarboxylase TPP-binding subunit
MLDGPTVVWAIEAAGFTHVVWVPDSHLGTWDAALSASAAVRLVRATREGEAVAIAAGLLLGGAKPLVAIQCTGFFEAGDAVRNAVHDLKLPLKLLVGVRSWRAHERGQTGDNCPRFAEPVARAWDLPVEWFDPFERTPAECAAALRKLADANRAEVLLWAE